MKTLVLLALTALCTVNAHAAQVAADAGDKINAACLAQTAAAKAAGELFLNGSRKDFCECVAGNHVRLAKRELSNAAANRYVTEILAFYKPLNKSESAQARAAYPESNDMDFQVVDKCNAK